MPSYAVLGSTGTVGQSLLKVLLQSHDNIIHANCRSKNKLLKLLPNLEENEQVNIFEGALEDTTLLTSCFRGTCAIFLAVAPPGNQPGCAVAQDAAHNVVLALERLRSQKERVPKLIVVSSASTEPQLMSETPNFLRKMLYFALSNIYDDLKDAEVYIRSKEWLVSTVWIKPGALCNDSQKGHTLSMQQATSPLPVLDLAAGMIEVANEESGRYDMKAVAVNSTADKVAFPWQAPMKLIKGLLVRIFPWSYHFLT